ncbi:MAG: chorismate--pyruvate lyase [gamma proteobacterium symbiont of Ctena orbiculata]|nr:MAG: chorismate--pyruvate lyase [gamma proteobacterium symbiont of Ctena orbiculata]PVV17603.1 MAG: chorismate--pyruvate lyase [gamma proteobacterium symbiont of Ctena orbiculata]PVV18835.1 MAG: chorismate--pyruvate lyase [gamma proteobacterium symbiont of Ctena orbiculata]
MSQQRSSSTNPEPNWCDWRQRSHTKIPPLVASWLGDRGSLTQRVIQCCAAGEFRVRLLHQGWGTPLTSECRILRMRRGMVALVRDVELQCDNTPWVFARTLIPISSLKGAAQRLTQLGEKPLGAVLFSDPKVVRGATQIAQLLPRQPLFETACNNLRKKPDHLWGRRTLFYVEKKPLLVNEIFLPTLPLKGGCS